MPEPTQPEGTGEQPSQGLPIPKLEPVSQASATSSVDTEAIAKKVAEILRPDFERVAQSAKDKRIAKLEKQLGISDLGELEDMGAQIPDNVKLEYRLRQLETQRQSPETPSQAPTSQGSGATLTAQDVSEVVKNFQLDANSPDVLEALRGTYRSKDHFEATMARLAVAKQNRPQPSAAESASLQISSAPSAATIDVNGLNAELTELSKWPSKNMKRIAEIGELLKKAG